MASSIRELILQQIVSLVDAATTTPVYRSRDAALASSQLPAIVITPIQDSPADERGSICWLDWTMQVAVDVVVGAGVDATANPLLATAHAALMADRELSPVAGVMQISPGLTQYRMQNSGGEIAFARSVFIIEYRTRHNDLTVAP